MAMKSLKFLKPDDASWDVDKSDIDSSNNTPFVYNPCLSLSLEQQRLKLPVHRSRNEILYLLEKYQVLVIVGETGCGKSTQIPQYLLEAGWCEDGKMIGVTEPRRVAAVSLASRVAEEKGSLLGDTVGFTIRFDDCTDKETTRIKYMTEGILMMEMMEDPLLRNYAAIMLDEVHEQSQNVEILMGLMKKILKKNKNLRLLVSSATVDAEHVRDFFNLNVTKNEHADTSTILSIEGRLYPVDCFYVKDPVADYVKATVETVLKIHNAEPSGDILCFLTGQEEVDTAISLLQEHSKQSVKIFPLPMYGSLTNNEQMKVFRYCPKGLRKVVVATNIAETSITIPGIVYVIDCGYVKMRWFDASSFTDNLVVVPISQNAAVQRAGRAGRVRSGKVYRLYTEEDYARLPPHTVSEIRRCELSSAVIKLKALGIDNVVRFPFPSPPPAKNLLAGLELLHALGAVSDDAELTRPLGFRMAEFPLSTHETKCLLQGCDWGCSYEMAVMIACRQVESIFISPASGELSIRAKIKKREFEVAEGDLLTFFNVYSAYAATSDDNKKKWCHSNFVNHKSMKRVTQLINQIGSLLNKFDLKLTSCKGNLEMVCKCVVSGFFPNAAYLHYSGVYKTVRGVQDLSIHPSSVLYTLQQPQWVVFCETVYTKKLMMRELTVVKPEWLLEIAPHFYHKTYDR
ncbi:ATP-dependent RNA helicase [Nesidiocoris tenuis]|uniref:RNA helicase n=1 Tax=Nesidiocoris tenuis TaxID=355587 RepID=A0ABN7AA18_9HEMI|nr:ATP-dependent RNA helicase [Nesidiocoris tenuis]